MHKKWMVPLVLVVILALVGIGLFGRTQEKTLLDPKNPTNLTLWHYYNSIQQAAFDAMVEEFNLTRGKDVGVFIQSISQGNVNELFTKVLDTANGVAGEGRMPDLFLAYVDSAFELQQMDKIIPLDAYLTQEDISPFVEGFWNEGIILGKPYVVPIAKSTELLFLDRLGWDAYVQSAGLNATLEESFSTWEQVYQTAQAYYEATDALTPDIPQDGHALLTIDSLSNFLLSSMSQLGADLLSAEDGHGILTLDEAALRRVWDLYMGSMARGYFASIGHYGSDDVKLDNIMGFVGSTASVGYFPSVITQEDNAQRPAELVVLPLPNFQDSALKMVQQGAGMVVSKSDGAHEAAAIEFIKWFCDADRNLAFAVDSGYLPTKTAALQGDAMERTLAQLESSDNTSQQNTAKMYRVATGQLSSTALYYAAPFEGLLQIRKLLDNLKPLAIEARATVLQSSLPYDQAIDEVCGDAAFAQWLEDFQREATKILENAA